MLGVKLSKAIFTTFLKRDVLNVDLSFWNENFSEIIHFINFKNSKLIEIGTYLRVII
jgi:hypothetical protein